MFTVNETPDPGASCRQQHIHRGKIPRVNYVRLKIPQQPPDSPIGSKVLPRLLVNLENLDSGTRNTLGEAAGMGETDDRMSKALQGQAIDQVDKPVF
jgi:hypothetical protein